MTDYRSSLKAKLAKLDKERDRLLTALGVLDELDSETLHAKLSPNGVSRPETAIGTMIDAVVSNLQSSGQMMTARAIHEHLVQDREVSPAAVSTALNRLQKRGKVFREKRLWGLVGRDDSTELTASTEH